jgi:hypothetical protein
MESRQGLRRWEGKWVQRGDAMHRGRNKIQAVVLCNQRETDVRRNGNMWMHPLQMRGFARRDGWRKGREAKVVGRKSAANCHRKFRCKSPPA